MSKQILLLAQELLNRTLLHCYSLVEEYQTDIVCVAGGCGLNTVANSVLVERLAKPQRLIVPPFAGDSGIAFGAAWLYWRRNCDGSRCVTFDGQPLEPSVARPGRLYTKSECDRAIKLRYPQIAVNPSICNPVTLAHEIASGQIVGVFNGRSEIGPRAVWGPKHSS